ncbi:MAG: hydroxymethylbilane synthase, partial [Microcystaceae cyanobacterium]
PIGVNTSIEGDTLTLTGLVASLDGQRLVKDTIQGTPDQAEHLGQTLAQQLHSAGAGEILAEILAEIERH